MAVASRQTVRGTIQKSAVRMWKLNFFSGAGRSALNGCLSNEHTSPASAIEEIVDLAIADFVYVRWPVERR